MGQCLSLDRDCDEGELVQTSCGVGACRTQGVSRCEEGAWVEYCEPLEPTSAEDLCDGLDEDCDGAFDEDFSPEVTSCGLGACEATGQLSCEQGRVLNSCRSAEPIGDDSSCDRVDDDCDGQYDEAYEPLFVSCGQGVCEASGRVVCEAGNTQVLCAPSSPTGGDADCDGLDNDCDGATDESFVGAPVTCGVGACLYDGLTRCINGVTQEECVPGEPAEDDQSCDGVDDDCDGRVDEEYEEGVTSCGLGVCVATGRAWCEGGEELSECIEGTPTGDDRSCNGVDEDCDGLLDESYVSELVACDGAGDYACPVRAETSCVSATVTYDCEATIATQEDVSCDGVDDDCDGALDEAYVSVEVTCGLGVCSDTSTTSCVEGVVTDRCVERSPSGDDSDCDGRDDDCDGLVDESFVEGPISCGLGVCVAQGVARCVEGEQQVDCSPNAPVDPDEASCDGLDNDCDGRVDEAYLSTPNVCGDGVCFARGSSSCAQGVEVMNCAPLPATGDDADCDGLDNDCDATTDEDYPPVVDACGIGVCYNTADSSCVEGAVQNNCVELSPTGNDADCDALDNDCDGSNDESYPPQVDACGVGVCASSAPSSCVAGAVINNCVELQPTGNDADCDGLDNDCDGSSDEDYPPETDSCGVGVCFNTAASSCVGGQRQNNCVELQPTGDDSVCNGLDDDCDGLVDEGYVPTSTFCTFGTICVEEGFRECVNGQLVDVCDPPAHFTGSDASCNGQDNDCDGRTDEAYSGGQYFCGTGVCRRSAFKSCVNGVESDDGCVQGDPNGNDTVCDGDDNDCDGSTDESFNVTGSSCGTGACASTGAYTCVGGSVRDSCRERDPTGDDTDNDGVDDDCDGQADEDYVPSTPDTVCDGIDSDQDGEVDEAVPVTASSCGEGACASTGAVTCVNGSFIDSCSEDLSQQSPDTTCDGVDDDCDGSTDEAYNGGPDYCGVGACKRQGSYVCSGGQISLDCVEGSPSDPIAGNNIDEDCDGSIDEGAPPANCGVSIWAVSRGYESLDAVCTHTSWPRNTGIRMHPLTYSEALNTLICTNSGAPFAGGNLYYVTWAVNTLEFDYWQIDPSGFVRSNGTHTCGGIGGER